jgi:hypothetical protein
MEVVDAGVRARRQPATMTEEVHGRGGGRRRRHGSWSWRRRPSCSGSGSLARSLLKAHPFHSEAQLALAGTTVSPRLSSKLQPWPLSGANRKEEAGRGDRIWWRRREEKKEDARVRARRHKGVLSILRGSWYV